MELTKREMIKALDYIEEELFNRIRGEDVEKDYLPTLNHCRELIEKEKYKTKEVWYHDIHTKCCYSYETEDSIKQIKSDMRGNEAVLDYIIYPNNVAVSYNRKITKSDLVSNGHNVRERRTNELK